MLPGAAGCGAVGAAAGAAPATGAGALTAAGLYELKDISFSVVGVGPLVLGVVLSFAVAYASIAWLLRFVAGHPITTFVWYRVLLGLLLVVLLVTGALAAT